MPVPPLGYQYSLARRCMRLDLNIDNLFRTKIQCEQNGTNQFKVKFKTCMCQAQAYHLFPLGENAKGIPRGISTDGVIRSKQTKNFARLVYDFSRSLQERQIGSQFPRS